jgi:GTP-binding protein
MWIWLRLKLIADAGLIGLPNAGKSTFLASSSAARPKIADYPFTTLHPGLGVVAVDQQSFVLADIPGLVEGAHDGVGLGHRFLGHVERCSVLLHLVDGTAADPVGDWRIIRDELRAYDKDLAEKQEITAISKIDAMGPDQVRELSDSLKDAGAGDVIALSAVSGEGMTEALRALWKIITTTREDELNAGTIPEPWQP